MLNDRDVIEEFIQIDERINKLETIIENAIFGGIIALFSVLWIVAIAITEI